MTKSKIQISTAQFENSRGRKPAGRGRWGFQVKFFGPTESREELVFAVPGQLTLAEAKRWVREWVGQNVSDLNETVFIEVAP